MKSHLPINAILRKRISAKKILSYNFKFVLFSVISSCIEVNGGEVDKSNFPFSEEPIDELTLIALISGLLCAFP